MFFWGDRHTLFMLPSGAIVPLCVVFSCRKAEHHFNEVIALPQVSDLFNLICLVMFLKIPNVIDVSF